MNVLIVYAHPEPKSFNGAMRDLAVETLVGAGHRIEVSDLYAMGFDPVGGRGDFTRLADPDCFRYGPEQMKASEAGTFALDVAFEQRRLFDADFLLLQFPFWWFGLPAILKGWMDRVLAAGLTYDMKRLYSNGVFGGRRAMLSLTTGAPPPFYTPKGVDGDIGMLLYPIQHGTLYFVGFDVLPPMIAYAVDSVPAEQRRQYLEAFRARLLALDSTAPIAFPRLEDYDEGFQLKENAGG